MKRNPTQRLVPADVLERMAFDRKLAIEAAETHMQLTHNGVVYVAAIEEAAA